MNIGRWMLVVALMATMGFGFVTSGQIYCEKVTGDEPFSAGRPIPYNGVRQYLLGADSIIGFTSYEYQANGGFGQRIRVDDLDQAHIDWMWSDYPLQDERLCAWNAQFNDGSYYGMVSASVTYSGYVQLDITSDGRTVVAYHYDAGAGTMSWIDIDQGNLWGVLPNDPKGPEGNLHIWPYIAVSGDNIIMVTGESGADMHHRYLTTDEGVTWSTSVDFDSCNCLSPFLRASPNSDKVVHVWTQTIEPTFSASQLCQDVYYALSTDNGANWSSPVNLTNYTPPASMSAGDSSIWAFNNVNAVFDANDDLHIAWGGHLAWVSALDTLYGGDRGKIFHWDEVSSTITTVSSPSTYYTEPNGFWLEPWSAGVPYWHGGAAGSWRTIIDNPQLIVDPTNNDLYCLWAGNADSTDVALNTYINGELYGAYSTDNGATWTDYKNLTNTPSPGAAAGDCFDEDYFTASPLVVNDSIFVTFIEDKDACAFVHAGEMTDNPVHGWVFPKEYVYGIEEHETETPSRLTMNITNPASRNAKISYTLTNAGEISLKVYDRTGSLVRTIETGYKEAGVYNLNLDVSELANGTYFARLDTSTDDLTRTFVVIH